MSRAIGQRRPLADQAIAFTGRLASMSRSEAAGLVTACGGTISGRVDEATTMLVVGRRGLPLTAEGTLSPKLRRGRRLVEFGAALEVLSEEEFLERVDLPSGREGVHRLYTARQLATLLGVPVRRLHAWIAAGLVRPAERIHSLPLFDFCQVSAAKKLCELARRGVSTARLRKSLEQLRRWVPEADNPLAQLRVLEHSRRLLIRVDDERLAEPSGQMRLDLATEQSAARPAATASAAPTSAEGWFDAALVHEERGEPELAEAAYRQALLAGGPDAIAVFNLANVLYAQGKKDAAAERFAQAVEIEPTLVEAWNNLANVLADLDRCDEAIDAYGRALALDPEYADVHYNLADCLQAAGRGDEAIAHWRAYLRSDGASAWARHARRCLGES